MLPPRPALTMTGFEGCDLDRQHVLNAHARGRVILTPPGGKISAPTVQIRHSLLRDITP